ncbi:MAG: peptide deformylase [Lachnospira sp.]|nr:peptide deformylase [Lachnospira sp.]
MIKPIMRDIFFLNQKSEPATKADQQVAVDLQDTLKANEEQCVGMAANMIGVKKNMIIVNMGNGFLGSANVVMMNPVILKKSGPYEAEEGCLSLSGTRKTTRYQEIEVQYEDIHWNRQKEKFTGWTAQIIQHEIDHCNGIII